MARDFASVCSIFMNQLDFAEHVDQSMEHGTSLVQIAQKISIKFPAEFKPDFKKVLSTSNN